MSHHPNKENTIRFINHNGEIEVYTFDTNKKEGYIGVNNTDYIPKCSVLNGQMAINSQHYERFRTCFHCNSNDAGRVCVSQNSCLHWNKNECETCFSCQGCVSSCYGACDSCTGCNTCNTCVSCDGICDATCYIGCNACDVVCNSGNSGGCTSSNTTEINCGSGQGGNSGTGGWDIVDRCTSCDGSCYNCDGSCNNCDSNTQWSCTSDSGPGNITGCQWCKTCDSCDSSVAGPRGDFEEHEQTSTWVDDPDDCSGSYTPSSDGDDSGSDSSRGGDDGDDGGGSGGDSSR